jgi:hypothetical protein
MSLAYTYDKDLDKSLRGSLIPRLGTKSGLEILQAFA